MNKKLLLCFSFLLLLISIGAASAHESDYPAVFIEEPTHNTEVSGEVDVVAVVDDHYETQYVNFTIEGIDDKSYKEFYQDTDSDDGWSYTWNTTKAVDGRYYLQARAINNLNFKGEYNILVFVNNNQSDSQNQTVPIGPSDNNQSSGNSTIKTDLNYVQIFGTYLGGDSEDKGRGVHIDKDGNIYTVMETFSDTLNTTQGVFQPTKRGDKNLYVAKFTPKGELVFATFIGGSSRDLEKDFKVDNEGNIYITGYTTSPNFPVTDNAIIKKFPGEESGFLTVLSADGKSLKYSTYLGGSQIDRAWALAIDNNGNAYIQGITQSTNFPITSNAYQIEKDGINWDGDVGTEDIDFQYSFDLFISKINVNSGKLEYSTYFGGKGLDNTYGSLAVDENDVVYFAGTTSSINFPTTSNANRTVRNIDEADSFITALDIKNNNLIYSSYIGGSNLDQGEELLLDNGFLYFVGDTWSRDFPVTPNAFQKSFNGSGDNISGGDMFIIKMDTKTWNMVFSTYAGGSADDGGRAVALDKEGNIFVGGMSQSSNFPVTPDAIQKVKYGQSYTNDLLLRADYHTHDAVLLKLSPNGELLYGTYLGGNFGEFIMGIVVTDNGLILQMRTYSDDLYVSDDAYQKEKADDIYNPGDNLIYADVDIYNMDNYLTILTLPISTKLNVSDVEVGINQSAYLNIKLTDVNNESLVNKDINVKIGDKSYSSKTNDEGIATIVYSNENIGNYTAEIMFNGNLPYVSSNTTAIISVINKTMVQTLGTYLGGNGEDKGK